MVGTIYKMDCIEGMRGLESESIDMVLCDLPYGCTQNKWDSLIPFEELWEAYERIVKQNGAIVLFSSGMFTAELMMSNRRLWRYNLIWSKNRVTGFLNAKKMPLRSHEAICVFYKSLPTYNPQMSKGLRKSARRGPTSGKGNYNYYGAAVYDSEKRYPRSVMEFQTVQRYMSQHPTQKPVELLKYLITTYTNEGDTVLDNAFGSGSTLVAAEELGRNFVGFETNQNYFNTACDRLADTYIGNDKIKVGKNE